MRKDGNNHTNNNSNRCSNDCFGCDDGERNIVKVVPLKGTNQYIAPNGKEFWLHGECLGKIIYSQEYNKKLEIR